MIRGVVKFPAGAESPQIGFVVAGAIARTAATMIVVETVFACQTGTIFGGADFFRGAITRFTIVIPVAIFSVLQTGEVGAIAFAWSGGRNSESLFAKITIIAFRANAKSIGAMIVVMAVIAGLTGAILGCADTLSTIARSALTIAGAIPSRPIPYQGCAKAFITAKFSLAAIAIALAANPFLFGMIASTESGRVIDGLRWAVRDLSLNVAVTDTADAMLIVEAITARCPFDRRCAPALVAVSRPTILVPGACLTL